MFVAYSEMERYIERDRGEELLGFLRIVLMVDQRV